MSEALTDGGTPGWITIQEFAEHWTVERDIPYYDESENERDPYKKERCLLDVYYPKNRKNAPVILFYHGGGFVGGEKANLPEFYKLLGCVIVAPSYRLSPKVKCPAYLEDGAQAAAWTLKNIERFHGDPNNIFMAGISAGAFMTAALCTMKKFLGKHGIAPSRFRGYMSISGEMITHLTIRAERGISIHTQIVDEYAPLSYVSPELPPLLMLTGDTTKEFDSRPADNKLMHDALVNCGNKNCEYYELPSLDHGMIPYGVPIYLLNFMRKHLPC